MKKEIVNQYNIVFNEDGTVKNCGRDNCIKLIILLSEEFSEMNFGDINTGFMNVEQINKIMKR